MERLTTTKVQIIHNFPLREYNIDFIESKLDEMFRSLSCAAKFNVSLGYLLKNIDTGAFRFFYPQDNNALLEHPVTVANANDLLNLKRQLQEINYISKVTANRPDTKSKFYKLTNVTITATLLRNVLLGCPDIELPQFLIGHKGVTTLLFDRTNNKLHSDNFCMFRGLAMHLEKRTTGVEQKTQQLFTDFCRFANYEPSMFQGVQDEDIDKVEKTAQVNVVIFDVTFQDQKIIGQLNRRSLELFSATAICIR